MTNSPGYKKIILNEQMLDIHINEAAVIYKTGQNYNFFAALKFSET